MATTIPYPLFGKLDAHCSHASAHVNAVNGCLRARKWVAAVIALPSIIPLAGIRRNMEELIVLWNSPALDNINAQELKRLADLINHHCGRLQELFSSMREMGLHSVPVYSDLLISLEEKAEHLASIGEGMYLSVNEEFARMVEGAVGELSSRERR